MLSTPSLEDNLHLRMVCHEYGLYIFPWDFFTIALLVPYVILNGLRTMAVLQLKFYLMEGF